MLPALLLIGRWIAKAQARALVRLARRRPLAAEVAVLRERLERVTAENDLLRARLCRLHARRRPHYRPFERLPHSAFQGQTPDEVYFRTGDGVPGRLAAARETARRARLEFNRAQRCAVCA